MTPTVHHPPGPVESEGDLCLRIHGPEAAPALVYLPGLHGDWTLVGGFREAVAPAVRFCEFTYPRTVTWSLDDYAAAIDRALANAGVKSAWLLAESFGSQIAWTLLGRGRPQFAAEALILAGGFVRHPLPRVVQVGAALLSRVSHRSLQRPLEGYAAYARRWRGASPVRLAEQEEFLARRTALDLQAAIHRLRLIHVADLRPIAATTRRPVFYLTGLFDPVVPWPSVHCWLKRHCPGYRGWRLISGADHNVLSSTGPAARQVVVWMKSATPQGGG